MHILLESTLMAVSIGLLLTIVIRQRQYKDLSKTYLCKGCIIPDGLPKLDEDLAKNILQDYEIIPRSITSELGNLIEIFEANDEYHARIIINQTFEVPIQALPKTWQAVNVARKLNS